MRIKKIDRQLTEKIIEHMKNIGLDKYSAQAYVFMNDVLDVCSDDTYSYLSGSFCAAIMYSFSKSEIQNAYNILKAIDFEVAISEDSYCDISDIKEEKIKTFLTQIEEKFSPKKEKKEISKKETVKKEPKKRNQKIKG